jgi:hypothetical protein
VVQISAVDTDQTAAAPSNLVVDRASRRTVPQRQSRLCPAPPRRICAPGEIAAVDARQPSVNGSPPAEAGRVVEMTMPKPHSHPFHDRDNRSSSSGTRCGTGSRKTTEK